MEDKLDRYLRETNKELKQRARPKTQKEPKPKVRPTRLKMWAASAAMDLFKFYVPLIILGVSGGILLIVEISIAKYCFYVFGAVVLAGIIFCAIDFYHYRAWISKVSYKIEGWDNVINSRSPEYWDMNGEHWLPVKIVITLNEPVNEKHFRVLETFLKKLKIRLNKWTVSKEKMIGYSQPNGWALDGLILTGDMNPRVLNLIRKKFSGELNHLCRLMPGTIEKAIVAQTGKEQYHQVYVDPTTD
jgi:hypothetical protein